MGLIKGDTRSLGFGAYIRKLLGRRVIERRGVFYKSRFVAHPVFPTPADVSCIVQKLRLKIVGFGLRRTSKN